MLYWKFRPNFPKPITTDATLRGLAVGAALCLGLASSPVHAQPGPKEWSKISAPTPGNSRSIGTAAAGCLSGAVKLPSEGEGYQLLRPQRNRMWAHPRTVEYVQSLAHQAAQSGLPPILIGDLSQPRGGPMAFGHGSHQHGLDVDIWFLLPNRPLTASQLASPHGLSMVSGTQLNRWAWGDRQMQLLRLAAQSPQVDRIFVNPPIKAEACRQAGNDRAWVAKLRPWWGHDEHFHVRLTCTPGDAGCVPQAPPPSGDGCGAELESWLTTSKVLPEEAKDKPNSRRPQLPDACQSVYGKGGGKAGHRDAMIPTLAKPVITGYIPGH